MKNEKTAIENPKEKMLVDLTNGKKPVTEEEKLLARQIADIKLNGRIVEIPSDL